MLNYPDNAVPLKELKTVFINFIRKVIEFPPSHCYSKETQKTVYGYDRDKILEQDKEYKKTKE